MQTRDVIVVGASAGAAGLRAIVENGGLAVVQDPADALHASMPRSARADCPVDHIVPAAAIGPLLGDLVGRVRRPDQQRRDLLERVGHPPVAPGAGAGTQHGEVTRL